MPIHICHEANGGVRRRCTAQEDRLLPHFAKRGIQRALQFEKKCPQGQKCSRSHLFWRDSSNLQCTNHSTGQVASCPKRSMRASRSYRASCPSCFTSHVSHATNPRVLEHTHIYTTHQRRRLPSDRRNGIRWASVGSIDLPSPQAVDTMDQVQLRASEALASFSALVHLPRCLLHHVIEFGAVQDLWSFMCPLHSASRCTCACWPALRRAAPAPTGTLPFFHIGFEYRSRRCWGARGRLLSATVRARHELHGANR
jgi:hypothetical protein